MSTASDGQAEPAATGSRHTAGAYDVRIVIAGLIGLYGIVLTIMGIVDFTDEEAAKTGDWNANLWAGIAMIVFALVFAAWARLRPVVVDPKAADDAQEMGEVNN